MSSLDAFGSRANFPFLHGIFLATNAISDAHLLVDGPDCTFFMAEHVASGHDWASTLLDVEGRHRVAHTGLHPDRTILGHGPLVSGMLTRLARETERGLILSAALPMAFITGLDYAELAEEVERREGRPIVVLPAGSLDRDWLDGYAETLLSIAERIELPRPAPDPRSVAIVGYLMDRNEGDHRGNLAELRRAVEASGLRLVSTWLDGGTTADLAAVEEAGHILALPHGRAAASLLASRTGAEVVPVDLPFGLAASDRFAAALGEIAGRSSAAASFVEGAHAEVARALEWVIPRRFLHRRIAFWGDPCFFPGFLELATDVGATVTSLVAFSRPGGPVPRDGGATGDLGVPVAWEPPASSLSAGLSAAGETDLVVSNGFGLNYCRSHAARLEFGFPSPGRHFTFDAPFLGHRGVLSFLDRMSNLLGDGGGGRGGPREAPPDGAGDGRGEGGEGDSPRPGDGAPGGPAGERQATGANSEAPKRPR